MKFTATRKPETVEAIAYTGHNAAFIEAELKTHTGRTVTPMWTGIEPGSYVLLQPEGRWQTLPRRAFLRMFDAQVAKSCFDCSHYGLLDGAGRCDIWNEVIDSEIVSGADCDAYESS